MGGRFSSKSERLCFRGSALWYVEITRALIKLTSKDQTSSTSSKTAVTIVSTLRPDWSAERTACLFESRMNLQWLCCWSCEDSTIRLTVTGLLRVPYSQMTSCTLCIRRRTGIVISDSKIKADDCLHHYNRRTPWWGIRFYCIFYPCSVYIKSQASLHIVCFNK